MTSGLSDTRAVPENPAASGRPAGDRALDTVVVLATALAADGRPTALLPLEDGTVVGRLAGQIGTLGGRTTIVITRPAFRSAIEAAVGPGVDVRASASASQDVRLIADVARRSHGSLLLAYGDIVVHRDAIEGLVAPAMGTAILAGARRRKLAFRIQARRNQVVSAASAYHSVHRPNASFLGVVRVVPEDLGALAAAAERIAALLDDVPDSWRQELDRKAGRWRMNAARTEEEPEGDDFSGPDEPDDLDDDEHGDERAAQSPLSNDEEDRLRARTTAAPEDVGALLLVGLVRAGSTVSTVWLRRLFYARPFSVAWAERAAERIRAYDRDKVRLESSVKAIDGFFTSFFVSPYSKYIVRWAARRGLTPNQVTAASMIIGALAAAAFATGERWGLVAGAVLLQVSFTTDCVDGQLARYTRQFSRFGGWLDAVFDRSKEYLAFAGLAIGAARAGDPAWTLACAAITLQTVRHMSDFAYMGVQQHVQVVTPQPPIEQPPDHAGAAAARRRAAAAASPPRRSLASRLLSVWHRLDPLPAMRWIKRMIAFPIGERFALISITAALFTARTTFLALLVWGGVAFLYTQTGKTLRSLR